jgi:N-acetylated-alpha-linked acidic dipeptidase
MTQAASPSLSHFLRQTALDVPHPTSPERTLWDARFDTGPYAGESIDSDSLGATYTVNTMADSVGVYPLGSGSDFTSVFCFDEYEHPLHIFTLTVPFCR